MRPRFKQRKLLFGFSIALVVYDLLGCLRELEYEADPVPVVAPAVHAAETFCLPNEPNFVQTIPGSLFVRGMGDYLQVIGVSFLLLIYHILQHVAHLNG